MINFEQLKFVLFDFDETLCIHTNHVSWDKEDQLKYESSLILGEYTWKNSRPNNHMLNFMNICKESNIKMGFISHVDSYTQAKEKFKWIRNAYGLELENFCVGKREYKVETLKAISKAYNLPVHSILIVDDLYITLEEAANSGFQAATPMEVVNYIEELKL